MVTKTIPVKSYSFNPVTSKSCFVVPSRDEYCSKQYLSVSVRLNFEYKQCLDSNGLVYFVTFTYNNNGCFRFGHFNFFDNTHIRKFFNKSIFSDRLHSHGYIFRFALFGECGDGKGVRGIDNNPHYHVLIYLYPSTDCDKFYHNENNFLTLCKSAWNQDLSNISSKRYAELNIGNVSYSNKGAKVLDSSCFNYCASYCIKTISISPYNERVKDFMRYVAYSNLIRVVRPIPNTSILSDYLYDSSKVQSIYKHFVLTYYKRLPQLSTYRRKCDDYLLILNDSIRECLSSTFGFNEFSFVDFFTSNDEFFLTPYFSKLFDTPLFQCFYKYLVNRHKCVYRLSPNLGSLGFDYINDKYLLDVSSFTCFSSPRINLPSYYFRKLFFTPQKHLNGYIYLSNEKYTDYCRQRFSIDKFESSLKSYQFNKSKFHDSLSDELQSSLCNIPDNIFVAYRAFRGFSFSVNDVPYIELSDIWYYVRNLDYCKHSIYSIPRCLSDFDYEYLSFSFHPIFVSYEYLDKLSRLYDSFIDTNYSSTKIKDTSQYFKLSVVYGKNFQNY